MADELPVTEADYARTITHYVLHMVSRLHEYAPPSVITESGVLRHAIEQLSAALAARDAAAGDRAARALEETGFDPTIVLATLNGTTGEPRNGRPAAAMIHYG